MSFVTRRNAALANYRAMPFKIKASTANLILSHILAGDSFYLASSRSDVPMPNDEAHKLAVTDKEELAEQGISTAQYFVCQAVHDVLKRYVRLFDEELKDVARDYLQTEIFRWKEAVDELSDGLRTCMNARMLQHSQIDALSSLPLSNALRVISTIEKDHARLLQYYEIGSDRKPLIRRVVRNTREWAIFLVGLVVTYLYLRGTGQSK